MKRLIAGCVFAAALMPSTASAQTFPATTAVQAEKCRVSQAQHNQYVRKVYQRPSISKRARHRIAWMQSCAASRKARANMRTVTRKAGAERRERLRDPWKTAFQAMSSYDRTWAVRIGSCESGNNPRTNTGNGFYGAMQWVLSTWHAAGGRVHPTQASIHEHWVRGVRWRNKTSTMQWPACSQKLGYA